MSGIRIVTIDMLTWTEKAAQEFPVPHKRLLSTNEG